MFASHRKQIEKLIETFRDTDCRVTDAKYNSVRISLNPKNIHEGLELRIGFNEYEVPNIAIFMSKAIHQIIQDREYLREIYTIFCNKSLCPETYSATPKKVLFRIIPSKVNDDHCFY
jgi:hypothetical protein